MRSLMIKIFYDGLIGFVGSKNWFKVICFLMLKCIYVFSKNIVIIYILKGYSC